MFPFNYTVSKRYEEKEDNHFQHISSIPCVTISLYMNILQSIFVNIIYIVFQ